MDYDQDNKAKAVDEPERRRFPVKESCEAVLLLGNLILVGLTILARFGS